MFVLYCLVNSRPVMRAGVINFKGSNKGGTNITKAYQAVYRDLKNTGDNYPAIALLMVDVIGNTNRRAFCSIYILLALLHEFLQLAEYEGEGGGNGTDQRTDKINSILLRYGNSNTISAPGSQSNESTGKGLDESDSEDDELSGDKVVLVGNENTQITNLAGYISSWLDSLSGLIEKIAPSSIFIGKVWTRIYFSLENAADELRGKAGVAETFEIFALCVVNAFLVEEAQHHGFIGRSDSVPQKIKLNNPLANAEEFIKKLKDTWSDREAIEGAAGERLKVRNLFPMTAIVATCPLVLGLLNSGRAEYSSSFLPLFPESTKSDVIEKMLCTLFAWEEINKISVSGRGIQAKGGAAQEEVAINTNESKQGRSKKQS